jgi:hypothetical protein
MLIGGAALGGGIGAGIAKITGSDVVAGAIGGAVAGLGTFFGPVAGAVSGFAGGLTESLIRQYRAGGPVSIKCALGEAVLGAIAGALFSGALSLLGKALKPVVGPLVRRMGNAIASKVGSAAKSAKAWAGKKVKDFVEKRAKKIAEALEKLDNGHSLARHGPDVTDQQLMDRITTGIAPDGHVSPTKASSRFASHDDWVKTREAALDKFAKDNNLDLSKPPPPGAPSEYPRVEIDHGRPVGEGFEVLPGATGKKITHPNDPNKKIKVYDPADVDPNPKDLQKTHTRIEWVPDPADPTKGSWTVVQHFPGS